MKIRLRMGMVLAGWVAMLAMGGGCNARKSYPAAAAGWHATDYSILFGRLQRLPGASPEDPTVWLVHFGDAQDMYSGEFALMPEERMAGYSGGERVEVRGHLMEQATADAFNGRWYVVDSIRMWSGKR